MVEVDDSESTTRMARTQTLKLVSLYPILILIFPSFVTLDKLFCSLSLSFYICKMEMMIFLPCRVVRIT